MLDPHDRWLRQDDVGGRPCAEIYRRDADAKWRAQALPDGAYDVFAVAPASDTEAYAATGTQLLHSTGGAWTEVKIRDHGERLWHVERGGKSIYDSRRRACSAGPDEIHDGTGKELGDRHPKIKRGTMIGAGAKILGNIEVGPCARVAAGSVVLSPVPANSTVAGVPAKIVGTAGCPSRRAT